MASKALVTQKKGTRKKASPEGRGKIRQIPAGEFKAKCLGLMREIAATGSPVLITVRGQPLVEVVAVRSDKRPKNGDDFIGRLEGIITINGDPDDLIKPVFALEDWDMLK